MDHRKGRRISASLPVEIWRRGECEGRFVTRDIGHGGSFVDGLSRSLKPGDFVDVKIDARLGGEFASYTMKAVAVHGSQGGVGLMWASNNDAFRRALSQANCWRLNTLR